MPIVLGGRGKSLGFSDCWHEWHGCISWECLYKYKPVAEEKRNVRFAVCGNRNVIHEKLCGKFLYDTANFTPLWMSVSVKCRLGASMLNMLALAKLSSSEVVHSHCKAKCHVGFPDPPLCQGQRLQASFGPTNTCSKHYTLEHWNWNCDDIIMRTLQKKSALQWNTLHVLGTIMGYFLWGISVINVKHFLFNFPLMECIA